jgi:hypothetical protein
MRKRLVTFQEQQVGGGLACQMEKVSSSGIADKSVRASLQGPRAKSCFPLFRYYPSYNKKDALRAVHPKPFHSAEAENYFLLSLTQCAR